MTANNPGGAEPACSSDALAAGTCRRDEGYLYWAGWLGHNSAQVFGQGDGNGFYRRIYLTASCQTVLNTLGGTPAKALLSGVGPILTSGLCP